MKHVLPLLCMAMLFLFAACTESPLVSEADEQVLARADAAPTALHTVPFHAKSSGTTVSAFCTDNGDFPSTFDNHGDCVSTLQALTNGGNATAVGICKLTDNFGGAYKNQGQCVSALRALGL